MLEILKTITPGQYREAANVIRVHGLATFALHDGLTGSYCIAGAVNKAVHGDPTWDGEYDPALLASVIRERYRAFTADLDRNELEPDQSWSFVVQWNNADGRTADQVTEILDIAAEKAQAGAVT
jgi:hypothetical protein